MIFRLFIYVLCVCVLQACVVHEYKDIPPQADTSTPYEFEEGDIAKLVVASGEEVEFKVTRVTDTGIEGDGVFIEYSDIRIAQVRKVDYGPTVFGTGGIILAVMGLMAAIALASLAP